MRLAKQSLQFSLYEDQAHGELLEAYERLIYDAMIGDRSLFANAQGIERLWEISEEILDTPPDVHHYPEESWGAGRHARTHRPPHVAPPVRAQVARSPLTATTGPSGGG